MVLKMRELADRLESGELHGSRIQWRHGLETIEYVEVDGKEVRFRTVLAKNLTITDPLDSAPVQDLLAYIDTLVAENERLESLLKE